MNEKDRIDDLFDHICPDCRCQIDKPDYTREIVFSDGCYNVSTVYIKCPVCGFRTNEHSTVRDCYKEWNECEL